MKNKFTITLLVTILVGMMSCTSQQKVLVANPSNWEVIGTRIVDKHVDHDELWVTAARGTYTKLQFQVLQSAVYVNNVRVEYANGSSENHVIQRRFERGTSSKALDLKGGNRIIKKIIFNYKTIKPRRKKAKIIVKAKR